MRISDWSSDVCSSDLARHGTLRRSVARVWKTVDGTDARWPARHRYRGPCTALEPGKGRGLAGREYAVRSEERRVGKEGVRPCSSRWSPDHAKHKQKNRH